jgi:hypothetical protein
LGSHSVGVGGEPAGSTAEGFGDLAPAAARSIGMLETEQVRKSLLVAIVPAALAGCGSDPASDVKTELEERGLAVLDCSQTAPNQFGCILDPSSEKSRAASRRYGPILQVFMVDGELRIARPV